MNNKKDEFEIAWERLTDNQKSAASWGKGAALVLAGPGSGKTAVLTCRIAKLLKESPDANFRILGLTFTNKAADEMRSRVQNYTRGLESRLFIGTFHSFCADVLRQHGIQIGIKPNFQIYSRLQDLEGVLSSAVDRLMAENTGIRETDKKTLRTIQNLKTKLISPAEFSKHLVDKELATRMKLLYPAFHQELDRRNVLDFDSLITKTYELFSKYPLLGKRYRTVFPYICLDEFQDTNKAQYMVLRALMGDRFKDVFAVADDDQIIFQWTGASHQRVDEFLTDYSGNLIQLPTNFRCPPDVVQLANNLIKNNLLRTSNKKPLEAYKKSEKKNEVRLLDQFKKLDDETNGVAKDIQKNHLKALGSVVVLARSGRLLAQIQKALQDINIPAAISERKEEYSSLPFLLLNNLLKFINDQNDKEILDSICDGFSRMSGMEIEASEVLAFKKPANGTLMVKLLEYLKIKELGSCEGKILNALRETLTGKMKFMVFCSSYISFVEEAMRDVKGDGKAYFEGFADEKLAWNDILRSIQASLGDSFVLGTFLQELQLYSKEAVLKPNTVTLMTIHKAKGKEFDHVYLMGLVEGELPSYYSLKAEAEQHELEEERRNCFVAITRAMRTLTLSYSAIVFGYPKTPSRFLREMGFSL